MRGFTQKAKTTPAPVPAAPRAARFSPRSPIAERIQRIASHENPFEGDAVEVGGGSAAAEEQVQTLRPAGQAGGAASVSKAALESSQGGAPLPPGVRQWFMEPRFGADFSGVQVHADGRAAELAGSVSARAFAYGKHLYFNRGEYRPESDGGKRVLAHELTHVLQQGGDATVRRMGAPGPVTKQNVAPWGGTDPTGDNHEVTTDAGSVVPAWKGYPIFTPDHLYWCHGHSLGTADQYGYSVYSGPPLATVLADEYDDIPPDQTQSGDIAVWTTKLNHSCKFTKPVVQGGALDHARSEVTSKNGRNPLVSTTLDKVEAVYPTGGVRVFRHK